MFVPNMEFCQIKILTLWDRIFKIYEVVQNVYDVNVTFMSSPKYGLLKYVKCEFWYISSFSCMWKKIIILKFSVKITSRFSIILLIWSVRFDCKSYSKFCTEKFKKQHYVHCDYNNSSMIYISSNMALLRVRNH